MNPLISEKIERLKAENRQMQRDIARIEKQLKPVCESGELCLDGDMGGEVKELFNLLCTLKNRFNFNFNELFALGAM